MRPAQIMADPRGAARAARMRLRRLTRTLGPEQIAGFPQRVATAIRWRVRRWRRRQLGAPQDPWTNALVRADVLPPRRRRLVAVIAADLDGETASLIKSQFANDTVRLFTAEDGAAPPGATRRQVTNLTEVREALARFGAPDVLVLRPPRPVADLRAAALALFLHLRRGGVLIVDRRGEVPAQAWTKLAELLETVDRHSSPTAREELPPLQRELAVSLRRHLVTPDFAALVQGKVHHLKVRDRDAESLLAERHGAPPWTVLARRPPANLVPRVRIHHHGRQGPPVTPITEFAFPALILRRYEKRVTVAGHSLVHADGLMLPESSRHHLRDNITNKVIINLDRWMARIPKNRRAVRVLPGAYFHLDSPIPGHYGHLVTEVASRLWAWEEAKAICPELKVIVRRSTIPNRAWVDRDVLTGFGIPAEDITIIEEPVFVDTLYSATPVWHNAVPHTVHPEMLNVWDRIRRELVRTPGTDRRIFVSRVPDIKNRPCTNTAEVEAFFADLGFRVVLPERLSLREQADLFAGAEIVAGFAGSGLFNVMYSTGLKTMIVLSHESYTARNEFLFAGLLDCDLHYFWSLADLAQSKHWTLEAFHSSWTFDLERHADELRRLAD